VQLFGYTPIEVLTAAIRLAGELMGMSVGQIRPGYLADLLLVDGDPIAQLAILQDKSRLIGIMKDGSFHKAPRAGSAH
jgi:imidazolonepropionase-like amidohydrolase